MNKPLKYTDPGGWSYEAASPVVAGTQFTNLGDYCIYLRYLNDRSSYYSLQGYDYWKRNSDIQTHYVSDVGYMTSEQYSDVQWQALNNGYGNTEESVRNYMGYYILDYFVYTSGLGPDGAPTAYATHHKEVIYPAANSGGDGVSLSDVNTGLAFGTGAGAIELGNKLKPFRPIRYNNGSLLRQGTIARNLNSGALMSGSRYLQTARGALYWTGAGAGVFGMGLSTYNYINGDISGARYGADMFFGVVGFMGPVGLMVSTTYYIVSSPAFIEASHNYEMQLQENKAKYGSRMNFMERGLLCFTEGTNITMGDGSLKPIESVMIGDTILTYDFAKERMIKTEVLRTDAPLHKDLIQISFSNETINTNTQDHPYFVKGKGWSSFNPTQSTERYGLTTSKLEIGDKCFVYRKGKLKKVKVTSIEQQEGVVKTYNLTGLKVGNSYFANGVLVNNENKTQNEIVEESDKKNKKD